jgi:pyridoxine 5'-phosphate synthase PdxJ
LAVDLSFLGDVLSLEGGDLLDAAALAHRADLAGADVVVIPLGGDDRPGFTVQEAWRVKATVRKRVCIALRGTRMVDEAIALKPAEVLFLSETGGPVVLDLRTAGKSALSGATARVRAAGAIPVVNVDPDEKSILAAQDAGAVIVEISVSRFGVARTDDEAVDAYRRISAAARAAAEVGLRVRAGGGTAGAARVARIAEVPEVEEIRVGPSLLAGAFYEGIGAAVTAFRREIARGARRGELQQEEE